MSRSFTQVQLASRHHLIMTAGICPDCEVALVVAKDMAWPHEECPRCGAHYLADEPRSENGPYRRMIQSFPQRGTIAREMHIDVMYYPEA